MVSLEERDSYMKGRDVFDDVCHLASRLKSLILTKQLLHLMWDDIYDLFEEKIFTQRAYAQNLLTTEMPYAHYKFGFMETGVDMNPKSGCKIRVVLILASFT